MSSTNNVTKVKAISTIDAILKRERQKKELQKRKDIEVGLTAAALTGLGATAGTQLVKDARKPVRKQLLKEMRQAKEIVSDSLDNVNIPFTKEQIKKLKSLDKAREAVTQYKRNAQKKWYDSISEAEINDNMYGDDPYYKSNNPKTVFGRKVMDMPYGIDTIGEEAGGMFVKEGLTDSVYKKKLTPYWKKKRYMSGKGYFNLPKPELRQRLMNRIIMQEQIGDLGPDTYFLRKRKGAPVTMIQELLSTPAHEMRYYPPFMWSRPHDKNINYLVRSMRERGIMAGDIRDVNIGYDRTGKPKVLDLGHSSSIDYEKLNRDPKIRKAFEEKNVLSKTNKKLFLKRAKQKGKALGYKLKKAGLKGSGTVISDYNITPKNNSLKKFGKKFLKYVPFLGLAATGSTIINSDNPKEEALKEALDTASFGLLTPEAVADDKDFAIKMRAISQENRRRRLGKEALDQKRKYDAKMRLEQIQQNKMRRQQRKQNGNLSGNMY